MGLSSESGESDDSPVVSKNEREQEALQGTRLMRPKAKVLPMPGPRGLFMPH